MAAAEARRSRSSRDASFAAPAVRCAARGLLLQRGGLEPAAPGHGRGGSQSGRAQGAALAHRRGVPVRPVRAHAPGRRAPDQCEPRRRGADLLGRLWRGDRGQGAARAEGIARAGAGGRSFLAGARVDDARGGGGISRSRRCAVPAMATGRRRCWRRSSGRARRPIAVASISSVHWSDGGARSTSAASPQRSRRAARRCSSMPRTAPASCRSTSARSIPTSWCSRPTSGCLVPTAAPSSTWPSATRAASRWSRRATAAAAVRAEQDVYFKDTALPRRCPALRHGRARSLHLHGDGVDRHGDGRRLGHAMRSASVSRC